MLQKTNIMYSLHEEISPKQIKQIAVNWLSIDTLLTAIQFELDETKDKEKIKRLEQMLWK